MKPLLLCAILAASSWRLDAETASPRAKRLVILKVDGLPGWLVNRMIRERDPATGKSRLPWIDAIFRKQGAVVDNFYVRGISLSVPSWSLLETGHHLVIHGNVEYDRYTLRPYDYMNAFQFYVNYSRSKQVDMPAVEFLDEAGVPLVIDRYAPEERYQSLELYQRGVEWRTLKESLVRRITSRRPKELLNEWQSGFEMSSGLGEQMERELEAKLADPKVLYLDYFFLDYDHVAHLNNDAATQYAVLKRLDALAGRLWTAIESSPLARDTIFVLVSDHGMNTDPAVLSQGYSLVDFFNSAAGGGHHVITNRHPLDQYKLKGLDPFVAEVTTPSAHSFYLSDQAEQYPTVLLDLDGNERASIHLRNNNFNELQILLQELSRKDLPEGLRAAASSRFFGILDERRPVWEREITEIGEEMGALKRKVERLESSIKDQDPPLEKTSANEEERREARRDVARLRSCRQDLAGYTQYVRILGRLLRVEPADLNPSKLRIEDLIPRRSMGDLNSIYDLRNYAIASDGGAGFRRVDYFALLTGIRVRNTVQAGVGNRVVDFVAVRVPREQLAAALAPDDAGNADGVWIYKSEEDQALILARNGPSGLELRYVPVRGLQQDLSGALRFSTQPLRAGLPLALYEDPKLKVTGDRAAWLAGWHTDREWLDAVHETAYSDGIVGLNEQLSISRPALAADSAAGDEMLLRRFEQRRLDDVRADMLVLARDHWNFNARNFNPGGNHGSFFRVSTHSTLMFAGAGVPQGLEIERPYDSLSFVPTILSLAGKLKPGELKDFPGQPIEELVPAISYNGAR